MYCLETKQLSHRFSEQKPVLNSIDLRVLSGSIYGFLGPNGAGKTTTLKLALGLLKKQQGEIFIFGKSFANNRVDVLRRTGSLIESPSLYTQLTAMENLAIFQKIHGCSKGRMMEVLQLTGLTNTGKKKAGQFSLGMKQRLGIAIAMLHDPDLLILDEPTNGLDPNGIIEMRELLKRLNSERGITILISSHLLTEIERLVSHVGVIHQGNLLFQGTLEELRIKQNSASLISLDTNNNERALTFLKEMIPLAGIAEGKLVLPGATREISAAVNRRLIQEGMDVYELTAVKNDLESIFMDLITKK